MRRKPNSKIIHVTPINDLEEHTEEGTGCKCKPRIEPAENDHLIVIHNSYDGREFQEGKDRRH